MDNRWSYIGGGIFLLLLFILSFMSTQGKSIVCKEETLTIKRENYYDLREIGSKSDSEGQSQSDFVFGSDVIPMAYLDIYDSQDYYSENPYVYPVKSTYTTALYDVRREMVN
jgi:hypothetical protein